MYWRLLGALAGLLVAGGSSLAGWAQDAGPEVRFERDIRPILSDKCYACHGPDAEHREADLRLDDVMDARRDRGGYAAIVGGDPDASAVMQRITSSDPAERMPPPDSGKELSPDDIERLRRWLKSGAPYARHWAYAPPTRAPLPEVSRPDWTRNPVDRYLYAGLAQQGLQPAPPADRTTLVRRLYFDLTGLPPTGSQVREFLDDDAPDAVERLADRLLASPQYGERMASYWFDLVRYANTVGYHGDQEHAISPYRDWVIAALNANMPFDEFTRQQLAGDLLPHPSLDHLIATGYNRLLQTSHEGGVQVKEYLTKYSADRVRNFGSVWLGSTIACAECHNHKFDPFTQADFYHLAAFFADIDDIRSFQAADITPTKRDPERIIPLPEHRAEYDRLQSERSVLSAQVAAAGPEAADANAALQQQLDAVQKRLGEIEATGRRTMVTETREPRPIRVLARGDWMDESGPIVEPAVPEFLPPLPVSGRRASRLDLVEWLMDRNHPLTSRVLANRFWYLFFGTGLSPTLDDFGNQGEQPVYLELLDYLSVELRESGWDMKHVVRLIVTSQAYQQSSQVSDAMRQRDPTNRLFARQSVFRLPAEAIRDQMLSISGLLVPEVGGVSSRPYQPEGYYQFLNFPLRTYQADQDRQQYRRAVYVHWQRQYLHPMLKAFDAPMREDCVARRPISNTPMAALTMLNDPSFVEGARALAVLAQDRGGADPSARIHWMWWRVLSREPLPAEQAALVRLYEQDRAAYETNPAAAEQLLATGLAPLPAGVDQVELAALTSVARALLNLNETITRR